MVVVQGRAAGFPLRPTQGLAPAWSHRWAGVVVVFLAAKWESKTHLGSFTAHSRCSISAVVMMMAIGCYDIVLEVLKE